MLARWQRWQCLWSDFPPQDWVNAVKGLHLPMLSVHFVPEPAANISSMAAFLKSRSVEWLAQFSGAACYKEKARLEGMVAFLDAWQYRLMTIATPSTWDSKSLIVFFRAACLLKDMSCLPTVCKVLESLHNATSKIGLDRGVAPRIPVSPLLRWT